MIFSLKILSFGKRQRMNINTHVRYSGKWIKFIQCLSIFFFFSFWLYNDVGFNLSHFRLRNRCCMLESNQPRIYKIHQNLLMQLCVTVVGIEPTLLHIINFIPTLPVSFRVRSSTGFEPPYHSNKWVSIEPT